MKIRNIILDLGGVIIDVDIFKTHSEFTSLGVENFELIYSKMKQTHFFDEYDKGLITDEQFRKELRKYLPDSATDLQINNAWNAMLGTIPQERIVYLKSLKKVFRLFLLSNTNTMHVAKFTNIIRNDFGTEILDQIFEGIYFSCRIHKRKPDAEAFEHIISENKLQRNETIFVDDSMQHVEGGIQCGIRSFYLDLSLHKLEDFLPGLLTQNNT